MKIKTSELTGAALDWAVAKLESEHVGYLSRTTRYSTNWTQGGPIIEREKIHLSYSHGIYGLPAGWTANISGNQVDGPTPLTSAMRCFVASRLGDEVEIPEELT